MLPERLHGLLIPSLGWRLQFFSLTTQLHIRTIRASSLAKSPRWPKANGAARLLPGKFDGVESVLTHPLLRPRLCWAVTSNPIPLYWETVECQQVIAYIC
jgi:hypothetical protein